MIEIAHCWVDTGLIHGRDAIIINALDLYLLYFLTESNIY